MTESWCTRVSPHLPALARGAHPNLAPDGTIIHSNGSAVFRETLDRKSERLIESQFIEHIVACA